MKQSKGIDGDLKTEHTHQKKKKQQKKTKKKKPQTAPQWARPQTLIVSRQPSGRSFDRPTVLPLKGEAT